MKIGFTGTREGCTRQQLESLRMYFEAMGAKFPNLELHHGDCLGADTDAHKLFRELFPNNTIIIYPPKSDYMRGFNQGTRMRVQKDYLERDRDIVDNTDVLVACPKSDQEERRSGTWYTIRYARKLQRGISYIFP